MVPVVGRAQRPRVRRLKECAAAVGCERLWLPPGTVDPPESVAPVESSASSAAASVVCDCCVTEWTAGGPEFWLTVNEEAVFPTRCPLCGCHMAQMTLDSGALA